MQKGEIGKEGGKGDGRTEKREKGGEGERRKVEGGERRGSKWKYI